MIIEYISDPHFDTWFYTNKKINAEKFYKLYDEIFSANADTIIIAGDLGHSNKQNLNALQLIKKRYCTHLIITLGNHDYYLLHEEKRYYQSSLERAEAMKGLCKENDIYVLDGDVVEIDGVRIGGAMGWYDGFWAIKHFPHKIAHSKEGVNGYWKKP